MSFFRSIKLSFSLVRMDCFRVRPIFMEGSPELQKREGKMRFTSISTAPLTAGKKRGGNIMLRNVLASAALASAVAVVLSTHANADNEKFRANLSGFEEVGGFPKLNPGNPNPPGEPETLTGPTGAIFSPGNGTLQLSLDKNLQTISYTLTYTPLSSAVLQAHIHFGKIHVPGGIMVFFCTNLGNGPTANTPTCPTPSGTPPSATVIGTWSATNVIAVPGQNITTAGNFNALIAALESDTAYGNIHTTNFPSGEIRGQIRQSDDNKD
jgi:hypothetical protein